VLKISVSVYYDQLLTEWVELIQTVNTLRRSSTERLVSLLLLRLWATILFQVSTSSKNTQQTEKITFAIISSKNYSLVKDYKRWYKQIQRYLVSGDYSLEFVYNRTKL